MLVRVLVFYASTETAKKLHYRRIGGEEVCGKVWCVITFLLASFSSYFAS